jgi:hypothetical protein
MGSVERYASWESLPPDRRATYDVPMLTTRAQTTLGLHRATPCCERCSHHAPLACAVPVIRWRAQVSSDKLRHCARCAACGHKGATIQRPGQANTSASCRFQLSGRDAARQKEPPAERPSRYPRFAEAISRRRITPADAVEVVAAVLNRKTLVHLSPSVPEIFSVPGRNSDFTRDPGKSRQIADIVGNWL